MDYYIIRPSLDIRIIGHYPQVIDIKYNCHVWNEPKFIEHLNFEKADFEPITANAILHDMANATDLIDVVGIGFAKKLLVSGKLKKIIQSNTKTGVQFFQSSIYHKNNIIRDYWIVNVFEINMEFLDFSKSNFVLRKRKDKGGTYLENIKIASKNDLETTLAKKKELKFTQLFVNKIKLLSDIKENFFILTNVEGGVKYIVSENLKKEIEDNKCTGIEFMPVEMSLSDWLHKERAKVYGKE